MQNFKQNSECVMFSSKSIILPPLYNYVHPLLDGSIFFYVPLSFFLSSFRSPPPFPRLSDFRYGKPTVLALGKHTTQPRPLSLDSLAAHAISRKMAAINMKFKNIDNLGCRELVSGARQGRGCRQGSQPGNVYVCSTH